MRQQRQERLDPFGNGAREGLLRRLAGAGGGAVAVTAAFSWWLAPATVIGLVGLYAVGLPLSYVLERRRPSTATGAPLLRYTLVATVATVVVFGLLGAISEDLWWWAFILFGLPVAAILGPLVAALAHHLPRRWLGATSALGLVTALVIAPAVIWVEQRPPAPHDFIVVNNTPELRATFGDAYGLAEAVRAEFDELARQGHPRRSHQTWVKVTDRIGARDLGDHQMHTRYHLEDELPRLRSDPSQTVRLITAIVRHADQACVVVRHDQAVTFPGACRDLDVADH